MEVTWKSTALEMGGGWGLLHCFEGQRMGGGCHWTYEHQPRLKMVVVCTVNDGIGRYTTVVKYLGTL